MDFQSLRKSDIKEYLGLFKDAGWEHVGRFGAWYYFRTKASGGQVPEIHTDYESRIAKYQRVIYLLIIFFAVIWSQVLTTLNQHRDPHAFWYAVKAVQIIISILMGYAVARLFLKINKIKKEFRVNREKEGDT
jgi:amino acid permease